MGAEPSSLNCMASRTSRSAAPMPVARAQDLAAERIDAWAEHSGEEVLCMNCAPGRPQNLVADMPGPLAIVTVNPAGTERDNGPDYLNDDCEPVELDAGEIDRDRLQRTLGRFGDDTQQSQSSESTKSVL